MIASLSHTKPRDNRLRASVERSRKAGSIIRRQQTTLCCGLCVAQTSTIPQLSVRPTYLSICSGFNRFGGSVICSAVAQGTVGVGSGKYVPFALLQQLVNSLLMTYLTLYAIKGDPGEDGYGHQETHATTRL